MTTTDVNDSELRDRALARLKKRRDFATHLLVYALVNTVIVVIWVFTSDGGFFWPIFPMAFWGIGVVMNAWDVWHGDAFSEAQIAREIDRLRTNPRRF